MASPRRSQGSLAYVFVYYYVFVYVGCTVCLWLVFSASEIKTQPSERRLIVLLLLSIALGLIAGSYLDPLLFRLGYQDSLIEEVRMRDIPFWFTFTIYAAVRLFGLGDAADYDSVAFFGYAALLCTLLLALAVQLPFLAALGSGSYFIYLWHIFIVMALRDHAELG